MLLFHYNLFVKIVHFTIVVRALSQLFIFIIDIHMVPLNTNPTYVPKLVVFGT